MISEFKMSLMVFSAIRVARQIQKKIAFFPEVYTSMEAYLQELRHVEGLFWGFI